MNEYGELITVYQRRYPKKKKRGAPTVVSLLPDDTSNSTSSRRGICSTNTSSVVSLLPDDTSDNTSSRRGICSTNTSSERGRSVHVVDLTSGSFDDDQTQPPSPVPTPPVTHTDTSATVASPSSIPPSSSFPSSSSSVTTDIEIIRTETVSSHHHGRISNMWIIVLVLTLTPTHIIILPMFTQVEDVINRKFEKAIKDGNVVDVRE